jgi:hypothetical protein
MTTGDDATPKAEPDSATRRSWYVSAAAADELAATVDELHYELRAPKHAVLAAVIRTGLAHLDEARDRVRYPERPADSTRPLTRREGEALMRSKASDSLLGLKPFPPDPDPQEPTP